MPVGTFKRGQRAVPYGPTQPAAGPTRPTQITGNPVGRFAAMTGTPASWKQGAVSTMRSTPSSTPGGGGGGGSWGPTQTAAPRPAQVSASAVPPSPAPTVKEPAPAPWVAPVSGQGTGTQAEIERQNMEATRRMALGTMGGTAKVDTSQNNAGNITPAPTTGAGAITGYQVSPEVAAARKAYVESLRPGGAESQLADELAAFRGRTALEVTGQEGQGRGKMLGFVRGMQGKIKDQANIQEQTLLGRLAAQQAQRKIASEAAGAELGFLTEDEKIQRELTKPFEANAPVVRFNPATGQYETVYTPPAGAAEGFTLGAGQQRYDAQGNLVASGPADQSKLPTDIQEYEYAKAQDPSIGTYAQWKQSGGAAKSPDVKMFGDQPYQYNPATGQWDKVNYETGTANNLAGVNVISDKVNLIDEILGNTGGLTSAVGPTGLTRWAWPHQIDDKQNFAAGVNQLISKETLDALVSLKERGGALGALSAQENAMLQSAASKIGSWMVRNENGIPTGEFAASEADFIKELNTMRSLANRAISSALGVPQQTYEAWRNQGFSNEDIQQFIQEQQGFTNEGRGSGQRGWIQSVGTGQIMQDFNTPASYIQGRSIHGGLDIDGRIGDPVSSPVTGTVISAGNEGGWGNTVVIEDAQGNRWRIAHMNSLSVRPGMQVANGTPLGLLGNTGHVIKSEGGDGSHVHLEIKDRNGNLVNPHSYLG